MTEKIMTFSERSGNGEEVMCLGLICVLQWYYGQCVCLVVFCVPQYYWKYIVIVMTQSMCVSIYDNVFNIQWPRKYCPNI